MGNETPKMAKVCKEQQVWDPFMNEYFTVLVEVPIEIAPRLATAHLDVLLLAQGNPFGFWFEGKSSILWGIALFYRNPHVLQDDALHLSVEL